LGTKQKASEKEDCVSSTYLP